MPTTIAMLVFGSQTGRLEKRFGSKPPLLAGGVLTSISFAMLAVARDERWEIYLAAALLGSGIGLAFAAMANLIIENVGPEQTGVATGMNTVTRTVGGAFGGAAVASMLAGSVGANGFPTRERLHGRVRALRDRARDRRRSSAWRSRSGGPRRRSARISSAISPTRRVEARAACDLGSRHARPDLKHRQLPVSILLAAVALVALAGCGGTRIRCTPFARPRGTRCRCRRSRL